MKKEKSILLLVSGIIVLALGGFSAVLQLLALPSAGFRMEIYGQDYAILLALGFITAISMILAGVFGIVNFRAPHKMLINLVVGMIALVMRIGQYALDQAILTAAGDMFNLSAANAIGLAIAVCAILFYLFATVAFYAKKRA